MNRSRGLSLVELLMAIFILGIGIISIAALFPAGIVQQRQSIDDVVGPMVANNALELIRTRVSRTDFGYPAQFTFNGASATGWSDFPWRRPAFFTNDTDLGNGAFAPAGSISIFDGANGTGGPPDTTDGELDFLYNPDKYPGGPPLIVITQGERAYPMQSTAAPAEESIGGQYYWDCMFRRYMGSVYVAIYVYRVTYSPGETQRYAVAPNPSNGSVPPLPISLLLHPAVGGPHPDMAGPWSAQASGSLGSNIVFGTAGGTAYDPFNHAHAWQEPRQWILDQNNNVYRVLSSFRDGGSAPMQVEMRRPVPPMLPMKPLSNPPDPSDWWPLEVHAPLNGGDPGFDSVVSQIWYIPVTDGLGRTLTPVFMLVEEL